MTRLYILIISLFILSSCITNTNRISPESLLSSSSEHVSFGLINSSSVDSIENWIKDDKPTEAELSCESSHMLCIQVQSALSKHSVPYSIAKSSTGSDSVTLLYERVTASDCNNSGFGCSVSANALQMVSDHTHFTRPPLSDLQDADKAVESYNHYMNK